MLGTVASVVRGLNGRLFLGQQDGFDLQVFTEGGGLSKSCLAQWRATLIRRGGELRKRGIPYIFFVTPDAPSVCREELPQRYSRDFRSPGVTFLEEVGDIPGVLFVSPLQALREARGGLDVYQKTDSHWTTYGSYVAYRELMRSVALVAPCAIVPEQATQFDFRRSYGDLGSQCDPEQQSDIPVVRFSDNEPLRVVDCSGPGRQTGAAFKAVGAPACRALAFRDSFMTDLAPYLARSFSDLLTLGTTSRVLLDAVDEWRADIVISQVAERRLGSFQSDHVLERQEWLYLTDYSGDAGAAILRATTVMHKAPREAAALIQQFERSCLENPIFGFAAGLVFEKAGNLPEAIRFASSALACRPNDFAILALCSRLALAMQRASEAVQLARSAVDAAPWNGALVELLVYALIQQSEPHLAIDVAEKALATIKDHANLWYWASVLHDASGSQSAACAAITHALELDPGNSEYCRLASKVGVTKCRGSNF